VPGWVIATAGVLTGIAGAAAAPAPVAVAPEISLSLREVLDRTIEVGEPLFIAVRVDRPEQATEPLELRPARGTWRDAISVEFAAANGAGVLARARPVGTPAADAAILDAERSVDGLWWFPVDELKSIAPGNYLVRAALQIRDGTGWKGASASSPVAIRVVAPTGDRVRVQQRTLSLANAAQVEGAPDKAAVILDESLRKDPNAIPVLRARAALALNMGDVPAAAMCLARARSLAAGQPGEPSLALHELSLQVSLAVADPSTANAPSTWSTLPPVVLEPVRERAGGTEVVTTLAAANPPPKSTQVSVAVPATRAPSNTSGQPAALPVAVIAVAPVVTAPADSGPGVVVAASTLSDLTVTGDSRGQWASSATASSEYGKTQYSAAKATGAPDIKVAGNSPDAWCPANKNSGTDWLEVSFAKPVRTTEVRVRQNDTAGAIAKVEAITPDGKTHLWWEGIDPFVASATRDIVWFAVRVPPTDYLVAKVKITLNLATTTGWKEIDAVQLVGIAP
jgi:hypothetical protein